MKSEVKTGFTQAGDRMLVQCEPGADGEAA